jgi:hypothetical protein
MKLLSDLRACRWFGLVGGLWRLGLVFVLVASARLNSFADVPPLSLTISPAPNTVSLAWDPSPDTNVVGYFLCWGLASGQCTNQLDTGNVTNATVAGFTTDTVYFFNVVAYDALGQRADPSNEVQCRIANPPILSLETIHGGTNLSVSLNFQGSAGANYTILVTSDLIHWESLWTTNCLVDQPVMFQENVPPACDRRFYRLMELR